MAAPTTCSSACLRVLVTAEILNSLNFKRSLVHSSVLHNQEVPILRNDSSFHLNVTCGLSDITHLLWKKTLRSDVFCYYRQQPHNSPLHLELWRSSQTLQAAQTLLLTSQRTRLPVWGGVRRCEEVWGWPAAELAVFRRRRWIFLPWTLFTSLLISRLKPCCLQVLIINS